MKPFTLAEYMRTLRLGKRGRNKMIKFSLYDSGDAKKKKAKRLFEWKTYPFDKEANKIIGQYHNRFITMIDTVSYVDYEWRESSTHIKIYLSEKSKHYKNNLKIYQVFINNKKF